jgi:hypothetical protein
MLKKKQKKIKTKRTLRPSKKKQLLKHQKPTRAKVQTKTVFRSSKQPVLAVITKSEIKVPASNQTPATTFAKSEIKTPVIKVQNTKLSRHVLDLKKPLKAGANLPKGTEDKIYQQVISEFQNQKKGILKRVKRIKEAFIFAKRKPASASKKHKILIAETEPFINSIEPETFIEPKLPAKLREIGSAWPVLRQGEPKPERFIFPVHWSKALLAFIVVCFIVVAPFTAFSYYKKLEGKKTAVLEQAGEALLHLAVSQKAAVAQDLPNTEIQLEQSAANFNQAKSELDEINIMVKGLIALIPETNKQFSTADNLMSVGEKLSASAAILTDALEQLKINKSLTGLNLTSNLTILKNHLNLVLPDLQQATKDLRDISIAELPVNYQNQARLLQTNLPLLVKSLEYFNSASDLLLKVLGSDSQKRYLVLFQNNNELRPTGGFIGSYALVDIDRGNVTKINVPGGGPYDLKAGLKAAIESPLPLHVVNDRWEFQDANWFADLPTSAEKLSYLFEKSGGPTVDGIIFVNATLIQQLLAVTGSIDLPDYQLQINQNNFINALQTEVEINYDKEANLPKQIIADLTPLLINKLLHSDNQQIITLLNMFLTALNQKEIQFYFSDFALENFVNQNNWGGKLQNTDSDYLNIVTTNIAGEKTDAKIEQSAILKVEVQPDGSIINNLTITKTHTGLAGEPFYGVPNLDYLRIYVPKGSELLQAAGFYSVPPEFFIVPNHDAYTKDPDLSLIEVTKNIDPVSGTEILSEENKTVFANWVMVEPGKTLTVTISYKLPFKLNINAPANKNLWQTIKSNLGLEPNFNPNAQSYSLIWQKQSGKRNFNIHVALTLPKALNYLTIYPNFIQKDSQTFSYTAELDSDKLLGIVFKP